MNEKSKIVVKPSSPYGEHYRGVEINYYSADVMARHKRALLGRAWKRREKRFTEGASLVYMLFASTAIAVGGGLEGTFGALLALAVSSLLFAAPFTLSFGKVFMRELKEGLPETPSVGFYFCIPNQDISGKFVAETIVKNYGEQVGALLVNIHKLRIDPTVNSDNYCRAYNSVERSLEALVGLATKDVVELWGGKSMSPASQGLIDNIEAIEYAITDLWDVRK